MWPTNQWTEKAGCSRVHATKKKQDKICDIEFFQTVSRDMAIVIEGELVNYQLKFLIYLAGL